MPISVFKEVCPDIKLKRTHIKLEAFGGFKLSSAGTVYLAVESEWKIIMAEFVVVRDS